MPYKTILVNLDTEAHAAGLAKTAIDLARTFSAHLIGLHVVPNPFITATVPPEATGELIAAQKLAFEAAARKIGEMFEKAVAGQDVSFEWRRLETHFEPAVEAAMRHGREADLVVVGQPTKAVNLIDGLTMAEEFMLGLGRPILIVPPKPSMATIGKDVLVCWNGKRESARAAFDALPFLEKAETVRLLSSGQPKSGGWIDIYEEPAAMTGIAASLRRHGIVSETVRGESARATVGEEIVKKAAAYGCDLIVMGGYGHWRLREVIFGGATRSLLDHASIPVLMSH